MQKIILGISLLFICFLVNVSSVSAATYYVSPSGLDTNVGSEQFPFKTITKGITVVSAGDTVYVRAGTYKEQVVIKKSGQDGALITLSGYPGERPVIDGEYSLPVGVYKTDPNSHIEYHWDALVGIKADHVVISGFEIARSRGRGVTNWFGNHNTIADNWVHDNRSVGVDCNGTNNDNYASDIFIQNNRVWNNMNLAPYDHYQQGLVYTDWGAGLSVHLTRNILIKGNTVYNNWEEGILFYASDHVVVEDNIVYDNWALQIYAERAADITIQRNLVYHTNDPNFRRGGNPSYGIVIADELAGQNAAKNIPAPQRGTNQTIVNNLVTGCATNLLFADWANGAAKLKDATIANNTLVNAFRNSGTAAGFRIGKGLHQNVIIANNIVKQDNGIVADIVSNPELKFSNNLWSRPVVSHVSSPTDIVGDPKLTLSGVLEPGKLTADYFSLKSDSPAIGKGIPLTDIKEDFFNLLRGGNSSMGAIEYSTSPTPSPIISPSPTSFVAPTPSKAIDISFNVSNPVCSITGGLSGYPVTHMFNNKSYTFQNVPSWRFPADFYSRCKDQFLKDIEHLGQNNFRTIRIWPVLSQFAYDPYTNSYGSIDSVGVTDTQGKFIANIQNLTEILDAHTKNHIKVYLTLNMLGGCGASETEKRMGQFAFNPQLVTDKQLQDRYINTLKEFLIRFKDHPAVEAYDLLNEANVLVQVRGQFCKWTADPTDDVFFDATPSAGLKGDDPQYLPNLKSFLRRMYQTAKTADSMHQFTFSLAPGGNVANNTIHRDFFKDIVDFYDLHAYLTGTDYLNPEKYYTSIPQKDGHLDYDKPVTRHGEIGIYNDPVSGLYDAKGSFCLGNSYQEINEECQQKYLDNAMRWIEEAKKYGIQTLFFHPWYSAYQKRVYEKGKDNITGYELTKAGKYLISLLPTPIPSPTTLPISCSLKSSGDADCNGKIDDQDYSIWLNSQCRPSAGQTCDDTKADFNNDGNIDDADYKIWFDHKI